MVRSCQGRLQMEIPKVLWRPVACSSQRALRPWTCLYKPLPTVRGPQALPQSSCDTSWWRFTPMGSAAPSALPLGGPLGLAGISRSHPRHRADPRVEAEVPEAVGRKARPVSARSSKTFALGPTSHLTPRTPFGALCIRDLSLESPPGAEKGISEWVPSTTSQGRGARPTR
jgi:hypothetical protein